MIIKIYLKSIINIHIMEQLRVRLIGSEKWKIAILRHYDEKRPNEEVFSISPSGWIYILEYQGHENNKHIFEKQFDAWATSWDCKEAETVDNSSRWYGDEIGVGALWQEKSQKDFKSYL